MCGIYPSLRMSSKGVDASPSAWLLPLPSFVKGSRGFSWPSTPLAQLRTALWRVSGAELGTAGAFSIWHSHVPGRYRLKEVPVCRSCASVYRILHDARSLGARHVEKREASPSFLFSRRVPEGHQHDPSAKEGPPRVAESLLFFASVVCQDLWAARELRRKRQEEEEERHGSWQRGKDQAFHRCLRERIKQAEIERMLTYQRQRRLFFSLGPSLVACEHSALDIHPFRASRSSPRPKAEQPVIRGPFGNS